ncbi:MAG TPA: hypothetical protein DGR79_07635 [Clostridiales bacterium]|nr:hypothetical protein [Clostridiales bacterium]
MAIGWWREDELRALLLRPEARGWLDEFQRTDNIFPDVDYRVSRYGAWMPTPLAAVPAAAGS